MCSISVVDGKALMYSLLIVAERRTRPVYHFGVNGACAINMLRRVD